MNSACIDEDIVCELLALVRVDDSKTKYREGIARSE